MELVKGGIVEIPAKLKAIRAKEDLTQSEFCQVMEISISTYKKYEAGISEMGAPPIFKIVNHPRFKRYTLWFMTGDTAPECGQISPL
ncbi:helix-turn-helix domain-containing protein [Pseudomonas synxantha]|jgi:transcriptional regulator with XRE-family HTH domain|uniref:helix-turn-helix domain-containing protein n=1 Tax=Pseudomonas synxantha TaxID=47883 RepID=UPI00278DC454|nr:helix-turn-helix transcriptional regulator [Pseudomonas synxantha]MDQ0982567.1 transcriptional regulator with XRE-family HTH domain [Pseudomonas synxantha]